MPKYPSKFHDLEFDKDVPESVDPNLYVDIISRTEWTREEVNACIPDAAELAVQEVLVTHTLGMECEGKEKCARLINGLYTHYKTLGLADIPHNFLISWDGLVFEGLGWGKRPLKVCRPPGTEHMDEVVQIAFIGTYGDGTDHDRPGQMQCIRLTELIEQGMREKHIEEGIMPEPGKGLPPARDHAHVDVSLFSGMHEDEHWPKEWLNPSEEKLKEWEEIERKRAEFKATEVPDYEEEFRELMMNREREMMRMKKNEKYAKKARGKSKNSNN